MSEEKFQELMKDLWLAQGTIEILSEEYDIEGRLIERLSVLAKKALKHVKENDVEDLGKYGTGLLEGILSKWEDTE